jgi:hypothetical protein
MELTFDLADGRREKAHKFSVSAGLVSHAAVKGNQSEMPNKPPSDLPKTNDSRREKKTTRNIGDRVACANPHATGSKGGES